MAEGLIKHSAPLDKKNKQTIIGLGEAMTKNFVNENEMDFEILKQQREEYYNYIVDKYAEPTAKAYFESKIAFFHAVVDFAIKFDIERIASLTRGYIVVFNKNQISDYTDVKKIVTNYDTFTMIANSLMEKIGKNLSHKKNTFKKDETYLNILDKLETVDQSYFDFVEMCNYINHEDTILPDHVAIQEKKKQELENICNK